MIIWSIRSKNDGQDTFVLLIGTYMQQYLLVLKYFCSAIT